MEEQVKIEQLDATAYTVPTETPESDGTIKWNSTTMVLVSATAGGKTGIGYTYTQQAAAMFILTKLKPLILGEDILENTRITERLIHECRNDGATGMVMMAISAVDVALWDLKARILELPLYRLLGALRDRILVYGSGGFTSYTDYQLRQQLAGWVEQGIKHVKMKIGRHPEQDLNRVRVAREAIGTDASLFTDANGAFTGKQACLCAAEMDAYHVSWLEEPVSSEDHRGLQFIRNHVPPRIRIAAGEYGHDLRYFKRLLDAGAVDVLQADATRCGGFTGFLQVASLCAAYEIPLSAHCAPALHLHAALAAPAFSIAEYFFDHVRIEHMFFEGCSPPVEGRLAADKTAPGIGLDFKVQDARAYQVFP